MEKEASSRIKRHFKISLTAIEAPMEFNHDRRVATYKLPPEYLTQVRSLRLSTIVIATQACGEHNCHNCQRTSATFLRKFCTSCK
jgi:hypothetical protein